MEEIKDKVINWLTPSEIIDQHEGQVSAKEFEILEKIAGDRLESKTEDLVKKISLTYSKKRKNAVEAEEPVMVEWDEGTILVGPFPGTKTKFDESYIAFNGQADIARTLHYHGWLPDGEMPLHYVKEMKDGSFAKLFYSPELKSMSVDWFTDGDKRELIDRLEVDHIREVVWVIQRLIRLHPIQ